MALKSMNAVGKNRRDILSRQLALSLLPRAGAAGAAGGVAGLEVDSARGRVGGLAGGTPSVLLLAPLAGPADDIDDVVRTDDDDARW